MEEDRKKVVDNIKHSTEEMYNHTIAEMVKRGCPESDIKAVEEAKANALAAYDREDDEHELPYATKSEALDLLNTIGCVPADTTPLMSNLFVVHIGEAPIYQVRSFFFSPKEKEFSIGFYEAKEFSAIKYFIDNKKFDNVYVEFLSSSGETLRIDRFDSVSVKMIIPDGLSYESDRLVGSYIKFKYKKYVPSAD